MDTPSKPESAHETETLPELRHAPVVTGLDLITELRVIGSAAEFSLLPTQRTFTLGSSEGCDIVLLNRYVSSLHCTLTRRGQRLRVIDQHSHNGTYFGGQRAETFDIGAGDTFSVAGVMLLALNNEMRLARAVFEEVIGGDRSQPIDELLGRVTKGPHVIMMSEPGCDQSRLARAIHRTSLRSYSRVVELAEFPVERVAQRAILDGARDGMLVLTLKEDMKDPDETFLSMLISADFRVRLCVVTPSLALAVRMIGFDVVARSIHILLRPLRERAGEIAALLDRMFIERRASLRMADLRSANQSALTTHVWPQNMTELREAADRLVALVTHESINKAAAALEIPRSTLQYWAEDRMHLEFPLVGE